jgi:hypothetical protein
MKMKTYTIIAYVIPAGGHHVETVTGETPTDAALRLRARLKLASAEFEVVAVVAGNLRFEMLDPRAVALAPFAASSP